MLSWRTLAMCLVVIAAFLGGLALGTHFPPTSVRAQGDAQAGAPIQEYRLANGVLCYTLANVPSALSCVYGQGLAPAVPR